MDIANMFTMPNIPTDSLYKFLFVGGVILIIFSPYLYIQQSRYEIFSSNKTDSFLVENLTPKIIKHIITLKSEEKFKDDFLFKGGKINKSIEAYSKQMVKYSKQKYLSKNDILNYNLLEKKTDSLFEVFHQNEIKLKKSLKDSIESRYTNEMFLARINDLNNNHKKEKFTNNIIHLSLLFMLGLGMIFTLQGIVRWYLYLQLPQDKLLKIQVELAEIELENKRKSTSTNK